MQRTDEVITCYKCKEVLTRETRHYVNQNGVYMNSCNPCRKVVLQPKKYAPPQSTLPMEWQ